MNILIFVLVLLLYIVLVFLDKTNKNLSRKNSILGRMIRKKNKHIRDLEETDETAKMAISKYVEQKQDIEIKNKEIEEFKRNKHVLLEIIQEKKESIESLKSMHEKTLTEVTEKLSSLDKVLENKDEEIIKLKKEHEEEINQLIN